MTTFLDKAPQARVAAALTHGLEVLHGAHAPLPRSVAATSPATPPPPPQKPVATPAGERAPPTLEDAATQTRALAHVVSFVRADTNAPLTLGSLGAAAAGGTSVSTTAIVPPFIDVAHLTPACLDRVGHALLDVSVAEPKKAAATKKSAAAAADDDEQNEPAAVAADDEPRPDADTLRAFVVVLWPVPMKRVARAQRNDEAVDCVHNGVAYNAETGEFAVFRRFLLGRGSKRDSVVWLVDKPFGDAAAAVAAPALIFTLGNVRCTLRVPHFIPVPAAAAPPPPAKRQRVTKKPPSAAAGAAAAAAADTVDVQAAAAHTSAEISLTAAMLYGGPVQNGSSSSAALTRDNFLQHLRHAPFDEQRSDVFARYKTIADVYADGERGRWVLAAAGSFARRFAPELIGRAPPPLDVTTGAPPPLE